MAASFALQPTNVRLFDQPYPILIGILVVAQGLVGRFRIPVSSGKIFSLIPALLILVVYDFIFGGEQRGIVFFFLLFFVTLFSQVAFSEEITERLWTCLGFVGLALAFIGGYRFFGGYQADNSQHTEALQNIGQKYIYFGISYLPSSRNSEALYFAVATLIFVWKANSTSGWERFVMTLCVYVTLIASALTMSRGVWIAIVTSFLVAYRARVFVRLVALPIAVSLLISAAIVPLIFDLATNGVRSLVDPSAANAEFSGMYTYSNDDRISIYTSALTDIFSGPFGHGVSFQPLYTQETFARIVHSENIYLDFLIIFGLFSIPFFVYAVRQFLRINSVLKIEQRALVKSIYSLLAVYCLFNSGVDFAFLWFVVCLLFISINSFAASCDPS